ncbi:hypothetical protein F9802_13790 [Bacillus aerolatus]|uniref:PepSY domain-containing protein n=1 Tax=Bacillus aerolatus TaxID=2653354 RepID=A0A6I1FDF3_9BACI|nr:PepSY domain-containing protein [Bacillus aerolatus]KAB7705602.1 hypothetical protein F9802_13790 [Bacillus aerolatus]
MNNKIKKFIVPALAAAIIGGGATSAIYVSAATKDKTVEQGEMNDQQEQAVLAKQAKFSEQESVKISLEKVPGTVKNVELDDEDGTVVYEVEVQAKDGKEQDVKIDAQTGKVIKIEKDDEDEKEESDQQEQARLMKQAKITKEESMKIALEKVPGTVKSVELDDEDGTVVYEVEVQAKDGKEQDVKIDVQTGKIVKIDNEEDDEDNDQD